MRKVSVNWHTFVCGEKYQVDALIEVLAQELAEELPRDPYAHEVWVAALSPYSGESLIFQPRSGGWGQSPYNPRGWKRESGEVCLPRHDADIEPKSRKDAFVEGEAYCVADVLDVLWTDLDAGFVKDLPGKLGLLDLLKPFAEQKAVYQPSGSGWGRSPFNLRAWMGLDGKPLLGSQPKALSGKPYERKRRRRHPYEPGHAYPLSAVAAHLSEDIETGEVEDVKSKLAFIDQISLKKTEVGVFKPTGRGWGLSPYNLKVWRDQNGNPLFPNYDDRKRRKKFSAAFRAAVAGKTGGRCYSCGHKFVKLNEIWVEHIVPFSLGGSDEMENLLPGCQHCNRTKSNLSPHQLRRAFSVGVAMVHEMDNSSEIGQKVYQFLEGLINVDVYVGDLITQELSFLCEKRNIIVGSWNQKI